MDFTPPSPTAYALTQFAAQQPALYTGTANISIPLHTMDFDGWSLPISLSYHAAGIRTNQEATEVGLGWSLSSTAVISRRIKKGNDFFNEPNKDPGYINDTRSVEDLLTDFKNWDNLTPNQKRTIHLNLDAGWYDSEPDIFDYNFFGYQGSFVLSKKTQPSDPITVRKLKKDAVIVTYYEDVNNLPYFTIETPDGFKGTFDIKERTTNLAGYQPQIGGGPYDGQYIDLQTIINRGNLSTITGWYVSKIESPKGNQMLFAYNISSSQESDHVSVGSPSFSEVRTNEPGAGIGFSRLVTEHVYQTSISVAGELSVTFTTEDREDLRKNFIYPTQFTSNGQKPKRYTAIHVEGQNAASNYEKDITFGQSYFNLEYLLDESTNNSTGEPAKYGWLRSRLDYVTVDDQTHRFFYNLGQSGIPSKFTRGIDHFGFYNGKDENDWVFGVRLRTLSDLCSAFPNNFNKYYYPAPSRLVDIAYGIAGSLRKVQYPTGGHSIFEYEPHDYHVEGSLNINNYTPEALNINGASGTATAGGLRIKEIATYEQDGVLATKKNFEYKDSQNSTTGVLLTPFGFYNENMELDLNNDGVPETCTYQWFSFSTTAGQNTAEGKLIGYDRVTEESVGENGESFKTDYFFTNIPTQRLGTNDSLAPYEPKNYKNGKLEQLISGNDLGVGVQIKGYGLYENFNEVVSGLGYTSKPQGNFTWYTFHPYELPIGFAEIDSVRTLTETGPQDVVSVVEYDFNAIGQKKAEESRNSEDELLRTVYKRLADFPHNASGCPTATNSTTCMYDALSDQNIANPILEKISYVDNTVVSATGYRYDVELGNVVLREVLQYEKSSSGHTASVNGFEFPGYRSKVVYDQYDAEGNVLQYTLTNGSTTSFIWGYDNEYPIVKGENITYANLLAAHNAAQGANYEDDIRAHALTAKALIHTYVQDPMVGPTQIADPSGRKTAFTYGSFRRLEAVKDLNNNLVQDYEYHYAPPTQYGGIAMLSGLDFGVVEPDTSATKTIAVKNEGNYDLTVNSLTLPTNFSSIWSNTPFLIKAGETFNLPVTYNSPATPQGNVSGTLTLQSTDNLDGNVSVSLSAIGAYETRVLSLPQSTYSVESMFDEICIALDNTGNSPITVTNVGIDSVGEFVLVSSNVVIQPNLPGYVCVKLNKPICTGNNWDGTTTVTISTDADSPITQVQVQITNGVDCNP